MKVGVLADTHGHLPEAALARLRGCSRLIHAGDVGEGVLEMLEGLGVPITVVTGNTDPPSADLPFEVRLRLEGVPILVRHIQSPPDRLTPRELEELRAQDVAVLIFGHSHRPLSIERGGVLFCNPGTAGQPRFGVGPSVGYLYLEAGASPRFELAPFRLKE